MGNLIDFLFSNLAKIHGVFHSEKKKKLSVHRRKLNCWLYKIQLGSMMQMYNSRLICVFVSRSSIHVNPEIKNSVIPSHYQLHQATSSHLHQPTKNKSTGRAEERKKFSLVELNLKMWSWFYNRLEFDFTLT